MKFLHVGDLHLGKIVNGFSMLEDQVYILDQILAFADEKQVDGILLAGDIYDRSIPPVEAVELFDHFLSKLEEKAVDVYIIAGNHDSKERLSFGNRILRKKQIYIEGEVNESISYVEKEDSYGKIRIYLLPFFRLNEGKELFHLERGASYEDVIKKLLENTKLDSTVRNVLMTHLFVVPGSGKVEVSDSEISLSIGGVEHVLASQFGEFDYVALGHIHGPQKVGREEIRYAGSILKYSFSEEFHKKSVVFLEIKEKGNFSLELLPLIPLRDMRRLKGRCSDLMAKDIVSAANPNDYVSITLTDEESILEPAALLRTVYPNLMQIRFAKNDKKFENEIKAAEVAARTPLELFGDFLLEVRGESEENRCEYVKQLLEEMEAKK